MSAPLTFPVSKSLSPELLHNNIDSRVVKIRPAATQCCLLKLLIPETHNTKSLINKTNIIS